MSSPPDPPPTLGDLIEVVRQRFFIDHTSDAKTLINEEFTIISQFENVTNIILQHSSFLPNLTVFDSDGEVLPVMSNPYTNALIDSWIEEATDQDQDTLIHLREQMRNRNVFLIWVKLPPTKALTKNQVKVLTLEYSSPKENRKTDDMTLRIFSSSNHRVFYIIRKPDDYDFSRQFIDIRDDSGKRRRRSWNKARKEELLLMTETFDSLSVTASSKTPEQITLRYSFRPKLYIISVPIGALLFLIASALYLLHIQECISDLDCANTLSQNARDVLDRKYEIGAGIIGASLVLPRLINNPTIRHRMLALYFIPVAISILLFI